MLRIFLSYKRVILILLLILFPILILSAVRRQSGDLPWYEYLFIKATSPINYVMTSTYKNIRATFQEYIFIVGVKKDNERLKEENSVLREKIAMLQETENENMRFRKLLEFKEKLTSQMLPAEVVATAPISTFQTIKINKGANDRISRSMAVVTPDGVVGQVVNVIPGYSDVLLLSDPSSAIDVMIQRTRARGVLEGIGGFKAALKYLRRSEDVQVGDSVIASGLGGVFPKGIILGKVAKVSKAKYGMTQDVFVTPSVDFQRLEEVFVVKKIVGDEGDTAK